MRATAAAIAFVALVTSHGVGQHADNEETTTALVDSVSVFNSGARITQTAEVNLQSGATHVLVDLGIPPTAEEDTALFFEALRVNVIGAAIQEFGPKRHVRKSSPDELEALNQTITTTREALHTARIRANNSESDAQLLDIFARNMAEGAVNLERSELVDLLSFLSERRRTLAEDILRQRSAASKQEERLEELEQQREQLQKGIQTYAVDLVLQSEGGPAKVFITWHDDASYWKPVYQIERASSDGATNIAMTGSIENASPLDWTNASIQISSGALQVETLLPPIQPVSVDIATEENDLPTLSKFADSFGNPEADILSTDTVTVYTLQGKPTIKSKSGRDVEIGRINTTATMKAIARPTVEETVFAQATVNNDSNLFLLEGMASLFVDDTFVGDTFLDQSVPPGTSFALSYGPMPSVTVQRTVVERETMTTGLLGGGRLTRTSYRIEIRNELDTPVNMVLEDRMPITRSDDIEVSLKALSMPLSTDANYLANEEPLGVLRWDVQLPAGGPTSPPLIVSWTVDVARSADIETTPIPE